MTKLIEVAAAMATRGAQDYLTANKLVADSGALAASLRSWIKIKLPEALADAKEALECHMGQVAEATFAASMISAGIEAAKEAGQPKAMNGNMVAYEISAEVIEAEARRQKQISLA